MMFATLQAYILRRKNRLSRVATKDSSVPCNQHITSDASVPLTSECHLHSPQRSQYFGTLEVIQELDEHIDEIQTHAHAEETSRQLDTPIDGSAIPVSHTQLKEVGDVDNSSCPIAHPAERYRSTLGDSPTIRLVADSSVQQRQLAPPSVPNTVATHVAPHSSTIPLEAFSRNSDPSTTSEPQTITIYLPRPDGPSAIWDDSTLYSFQVQGF